MLSVILAAALCGPCIANMSGNCPNGVCTAPMRTVVEKTKTVVVNREVAPVRRVVKHRHILRFRRG